MDYSRGVRRRRVSPPRALAAICGGLAIALALTIGIRSIDTTEASWTDDVHASASFEAGTLEKVNNLTCSSGSILGGLLKDKVKLSWTPPYEGFAGKYEVAMAPTGILVSEKIVEIDATEFTYTVPLSLLNVGATVAVRPVLGEWKGEAVGYFVSIVGVLLPLYTNCVNVIEGVISIFGPSEPNGLLAPDNRGSALQVADAIKTSPSKVTSSTAESTSPAATTSTVSDGHEEETTTSSSRMTPARPSTASTTSIRLSPSPVTESMSPTKVPTPSITEPTRTNTSTPSPSDSTPPAESTTTSTLAAPEIVIPDEPGTLTALARLEDVETVTVGEDDHLVVVKGDTVPTDARHGGAALETWLGGGNPGTTWETFASDDPDRDGWRWAAINQETGTVVYIR